MIVVPVPWSPIRQCAVQSQRQTGAPFVARACWSSGPPLPNELAIRRTLRLRGRGDPVESPTEPSVPEGTGQADAVKMTPYRCKTSRYLHLFHDCYIRIPTVQSASAANETGVITNAKRSARRRAHKDGGGAANGTAPPSFSVIERH
jgi:hypothetical protein